MEKRSYCTICKYFGKFHNDEQALERAKIFGEKGSSIAITLCRKHAIDLFKHGQKIFLMDHYQILNEIPISEDENFMKVLEQTVRKNIDSIF